MLNTPSTIMAWRLSDRHGDSSSFDNVNYDAYSEQQRCDNAKTYPTSFFVGWN